MFIPNVAIMKINSTAEYVNNVLPYYSYHIRVWPVVYCFASIKLIFMYLNERGFFPLKFIF